MPSGNLFRLVLFRFFTHFTRTVHLHTSVSNTQIHLLRTWGGLFASVQTARTLLIFFHHCAMRLETSAPSFDEGEVQICWSSNILGSDETIIHSWSSTAWRKHVKKYIITHTINMHRNIKLMVSKISSQSSYRPKWAESSALQEDLELPFSTRGPWRLLDIRACSRSWNTVEVQYNLDFEDHRTLWDETKIGQQGNFVAWQDLKIKAPTVCYVW